MKENGSVLVLLDGHVPNELNSKGAGAMGGVGGGGGRPMLNQDGARARRRKGGGNLVLLKVM